MGDELQSLEEITNALLLNKDTQFTEEEFIQVYTENFDLMQSVILKNQEIIVSDKTKSFDFNSPKYCSLNSSYMPNRNYNYYSNSNYKSKGLSPKNPFLPENYKIQNNEPYYNSNPEKNPFSQDRLRTGNSQSYKKKIKEIIPNTVSLPSNSIKYPPKIVRQEIPKLPEPIPSQNPKNFSLPYSSQYLKTTKTSNEEPPPLVSRTIPKAKPQPLPEDSSSPYLNNKRTPPPIPLLRNEERNQFSHLQNRPNTRQSLQPPMLFNPDANRDLFLPSSSPSIPVPSIRPLPNPYQSAQFERKYELSSNDSVPDQTSPDISSLYNFSNYPPPLRNPANRNDLNTGHRYPNYQDTSSELDEDLATNDYPYLGQSFFHQPHHLNPRSINPGQRDYPRRYLYNFYSSDSEDLNYEELVELEYDLYNKGNGFKEEDIINLGEEEYVSDPNQILCVICQMPFEESEKITRLKCTHILHSPCALEWLQRKKRCPVCCGTEKIV